MSRLKKITNSLQGSPSHKGITFVANSWVAGATEAICVPNKSDYHWQIFPSDHEIVATVNLGEVKELLHKANLYAG